LHEQHRLIRYRLTVQHVCHPSGVFAYPFIYLYTNHTRFFGVNSIRFELLFSVLTQKDRLFTNLG
jgi:hypothetical protein